MSKQEIFQVENAEKYSDYFFDKYLSQECSKEEVEIFEAKLLSHDLLRKRFAAFNEADRAFAEKVPEMSTLLNVHKNQQKTNKPFSFFDVLQKWWFKGGVPVVLAAACLFLFLKPTASSDTGTRFKGGQKTFLRFYVQRKNTSKLIVGEKNIQLHPNDKLQFIVSSEEKSYVAIFSKDPLGVISRYAPEKEAMAHVQGEYRFKSSITLDENLGAEELLALKCIKAHELDELMIELNKQWLTIPNDCVSEKITVLKVSNE